MGFQLSAVFSSAVDHDLKGRLLNDAKTRWPFIRIPRTPGFFDEHLQFSPPEMTGYLFDDETDRERVLEENFLVENHLADWSHSYLDVDLAFVEVDCFGGVCLYSGFLCRGGKILRKQEATQSGHVDLLDKVGFTVSYPFPPFVRGYCEGKGSGGFEASS